MAAGVSVPLAQWSANHSAEILQMTGTKNPPVSAEGLCVGA